MYQLSVSKVNRPECDSRSSSRNQIVYTLDYVTITIRLERIKLSRTDGSHWDDRRDKRSQIDRERVIFEYTGSIAVSIALFTLGGTPTDAVGGAIPKLTYHITSLNYRRDEQSFIFNIFTINYSNNNDNKI